MSYSWPIRSVEQLPPYTPAKLKIPVLVIGNTVRLFFPSTESFPRTDPIVLSQADPITPLVSARKTANELGDNAFLVEQLGFGHSSLAQTSSCTLNIVSNYFVNSTVGVVTTY
jgi:hypothetical protein